VADDGRRKWLLGGIYLATFMTSTDVVSVGVLLVPIERSFDTTLTTAQWVMNAYALVFAMLIVTCGRLADMRGRRQLIIIGLSLFAAASVVDALAPSIGWLIAARAVQGAGAAVFFPSLMAIAFLTAPPGRGAARLGIFFGIMGIGSSSGPIIAGFLADVGPWGWRLFFALNVLISLVSLLLLSRVATPPSPPNERQEKIDYAGVCALAGAVFCLLFGLERAARGADAGTLFVLFGASVVLCVLFPFIERRVRDPLVPPDLWRNRAFVAGVCLNAVVVGAPFVVLVFIPQYTSEILGWSPRASGLGLLPITVFAAGLGPISGHFYSRIGPRRMLTVGLTMATAGSLYFVMAPSDWGYFGAIVPGLVLSGIGMGINTSTSGAVAVAAVSKDRATLASGIGFQFHLAFAAIAIGVATLLLVTTVHSDVRADLKSAGAQVSQAELVALEGARSRTTASVAALDRLSSSDQAIANTAVEGGFRSGLRLAFVFAAIATALGFGLIPLLPAKGR
jgi:EmrB/QacA subfamily drug resistance transporter